MNSLIISFCENNKGRKKIINRISEEYPHVETCIKKCIGKCSICSEAAMAIVEDKLVVGRDTEELYKKISKIIKGSV